MATDAATSEHPFGEDNSSHKDTNYERIEGLKERTCRRCAREAGTKAQRRPVLWCCHN